jgi:hypothetical protein
LNMLCLRDLLHPAGASRVLINGHTNRLMAQASRM